MAGKTLADALSQLSAANIERIEVIDNPTSEYRAEGGSGIINIINNEDRYETRFQRLDTYKLSYTIDTPALKQKVENAGIRALSM